MKKLCVGCQSSPNQKRTHWVDFVELITALFKEALRWSMLSSLFLFCTDKWIQRNIFVFECIVGQRSAHKRKYEWNYTVGEITRGPRRETRCWNAGPFCLEFGPTVIVGKEAKESYSKCDFSFFYAVQSLYVIIWFHFRVLHASILNTLSTRLVRRNELMLMLRMFNSFSARLRSRSSTAFIEFFTRSRKHTCTHSFLLSTIPISSQIKKMETKVQQYAITQRSSHLLLTVFGETLIKILYRSQRGDESRIKIHLMACNTHNGNYTSVKGHKNLFRDETIQRKLRFLSHKLELAYKD